MKKLIAISVVLILCVTMLLPATASEILYGDVNSDGCVNMFDMSVALQYFGELIGEDEIDMTNSDVNGDGIVNMLDMSIMLQYFGDLITEFPAENGVSESEERTLLTTKEVYEKARQYTVEVLAESSDFISTGSGFFIDEYGTVATNAHVIEDTSYIYVKDYNDVQYDVTSVIAYDRDMDLAILATECTSSVAAKFCYERETAEQIYTLGSSLGLTGTFSDGLVSSPSRYQNWYMDGTVELIQITAPISSGNSGGPLINAYGEVIGLNSYGLTDGENLNFAIPVEYLDSMDKSNPQTMEQFAGGEVYNPGEERTPITEITDDMLVVDTTGLWLRPGGIAVVPVMLDDRLDDGNLNVETQNVNYVSCEWAENTWSSSSMTISFLFIKAEAYTNGTTITVSYSDGGEKYAPSSFTVYVSSDGWLDYGNLAGCPDFGAVTGVLPTTCFLDDETEVFGFGYDAYDFPGNGYVDPERVQAQYENVLCTFNYSITNSGTLDDGSDYTIYVDDVGDEITFVITYDEYGYVDSFVVFVDCL